MQRPDETSSNWNQSQRRSVSQILERRRKKMKNRRKMFPPDFVHGDVPVGQVYDVLGQDWAERALFGVDDAEVTTVAYFDDYFLVVEQWTEQHRLEWGQWWERHSDRRDRVVTLDVEEGCRLSELATVPIEIERSRLRDLEQGVLGVARETMSGDSALDERRCQGEIDVLSLVTLVSRLFREHSSIGG